MSGSSGRQSGWAELVEELDQWGESGAIATFWWRDDDAIDPTPQLETLLSCADGVPLALAVIPDKASRALARRLTPAGNVSILQHGWRHDNHLQGGLCEYPAHRVAAEVAREIVQGRARLRRLFGEQALAVFVPPWHGFADEFLVLLPECGVTAISRKGARAGAMAAPGLMQANAHVAPIKWTEPPSFENDAYYLAAFIDHLTQRRTGTCDRNEATGLLTHHLAQNAQSFEFIARLLALVSAHDAATWLSPSDIFAPALGAWS